MRTHDWPRELLDSSLAPEAPLTDAVRWAVAHAALAPSELNSQPWRFRAALEPHGRAATLELLLDESRLLPTVDPTAREAVLACGAALLNLRLALDGAALGNVTRLCPEPDRPELLAEIRVQGSIVEADDDRPLRLAIPLRGTHRSDFEPGPPPARAVDRLVAAAVREGASVVVLADATRREVEVLHQAAERWLWIDPGFRREVAAKRVDHSAAYEPVAGRTLREAPLLLVIGAADESRPALLRAGAGLQRLLLQATAEAMAASFLNASLHVPDLRRALGRTVQLEHPQVMLRVGYAPLDATTPRRPESAFLELRKAVR